MALRREVKNIVKLFSDIEIKVREATSNDPWGAPTSLLSEIADATNDKKALSEIMQLLWKRLGENGKNWRHVHKSLIVLDYIVKTGSESVAEQCKENIFSIKTLEEFKYIDKDGKDQGINVREKSKQLVDLLKDGEILNGERERALKAKNVIHANSGASSTNSNKVPKHKKFLSKRLKRKGAKDNLDESDNPSEMRSDSDQASDSGSDAQGESELEKARPSTEVEEELQLQIALATSREDAEVMNTTKSDEPVPVSTPAIETPTLLNLLDLDVPITNTDTSVFMHQTTPQPTQKPTVDPWTSSDITVNQSLDPFQSNVDLFDNSSPFFSHDSFGVAHQQISSTPHSNFIEIGAHLVDFNNIVSASSTEKNPFKPSIETTSKNPFSQEKPKAKSINELRLDGATYFEAPGMTTGTSQNPFSASWKKQVEVM